MLELTLPTDEVVEVPAPPEVAQALLDDVSDSAAHFPKVEGVEPRGGRDWIWRLEKIGLGPVSLQTVYGLRYRSEPGRIEWEPLSEVGNAEARGAWSITPAPAGSRLRFQNQLRVRFRGAPRALRRVVEPLAVRENERVVRAYLENLRQTFAGGDGRLRSGA